MADEIKMGRPTDYSKEMVDAICAAIAISERGLHHICKENPNLPAVTTIMRWLSEKDKDYFREQYAYAREAQADYMIDQMMVISDDSKDDTIETSKGDFPNNEWINRSRLRVDTRKWVLSKLLPKKYGDRLEVETPGPITINPIIFRHEAV